MNLLEGFLVSCLIALELAGINWIWPNVSFHVLAGIATLNLAAVIGVQWVIYEARRANGHGLDQ